MSCSKKDRPIITPDDIEQARQTALESPDSHCSRWVLALCKEVVFLHDELFKVRTVLEANRKERGEV